MFFKATRDQLKANALISHLEFAKARLRPDLISTADHLKGAQKAMEKVKLAGAEYIFTRKAWLYVIELCEELGKVLREARREELVRECVSIYEWALKNEDQIAGGGMLSIVRSALANDEGTAFRLCAEIAAQGDPEAQSELGKMYAEGRGVTQDDVQAFCWIEKAALQGYAQAQYNLGILYERGRGKAIPKRSPS